MNQRYVTWAVGQGTYRRFIRRYLPSAGWTGGWMTYLQNKNYDIYFWQIEKNNIKIKKFGKSSGSARCFWSLNWAMLGSRSSIQSEPRSVGPRMSPHPRIGPRNRDERAQLIHKKMMLACRSTMYISTSSFPPLCRWPRTRVLEILSSQECV